MGRVLRKMRKAWHGPSGDIIRRHIAIRDPNSTVNRLMREFVERQFAVESPMYRRLQETSDGSSEPRGTVSCDAR